MKVVLIGHKARQGKDTFAEMLKNILITDRGVKASIFNFASPMKEIVAEALGVSRDTLDALKNENEHYRAILQRFGSGKMKDYFGSDVWKKLTLEHIDTLEDIGVECVIIPDFRFHEEFIDGAITVNVIRPGVKISDSHVSETAMDDYVYDEIINNDRDLESLERKAVLFSKKIIEGMW